MIVDASESKTARGGTELMAERLSNHLESLGLYDDFQIVCSRVRQLNDKIRIFWAHDLPGDPESEFMKDQNKLNMFDHYVFVSNWQLNAYASYYKLPLDKCTVIPNAIVPLEADRNKSTKTINLIYYSTPHRGLELLVPVFEALHNKYGHKIHLDIFSSFEIYGWSERDAPYQDLFKRCKDHSGITYHGSAPNEKIRETLETKSHILAYPSIWQETSCLVLIEAMSAGLTCVHSNLAALPETSASLTHQYPYDPNPNSHALRFYNELENAILNYDGFDGAAFRHTEAVYNIDVVLYKWEQLLQKVRLVKEESSTFTVRA